MNQDLVAPDAARGARSAASLLTTGGVCGLAWAAGLRGLMAELAKSGSTIGWYDTFVQVLLPATVTPTRDYFVALGDTHVADSRFA